MILGVGSLVSLIVSILTKLETDKALAVLSPALASASGWCGLIF